MAVSHGNLRTLMSSVEGPGKLAPALVEDLHIHDPRFTLASGLNVLRDVPLFYSGYDNIAALLSPASCRHSWYAKDNQQVVPNLGARPSLDSIYKFAGVCRKCRMHLVLEVDYTVNWEPEPCPNSTYPLHHLVHSPCREGTARSEGISACAGDKIETLAFECSSPKCSATVFVQFARPVLSDNHVRLLTDKALLSERANKVIGLDPARFEGHRKPTAVDVLSDLKTYMRNSLEHKQSRPIRADNKRFMLRFGVDGREAKDILLFLGFRHDPSEYWLPPHSASDESAPLRDSASIFIDNVVCEISILISQLPEDERRQTQENTTLSDADKVALRVVGAQDYDRHPSARTVVTDSSTRDMYVEAEINTEIAHMRTSCYSALGAPQDGSDELVSYAYQQQVRTNKKESPVYLSYLRQIANSRKSELLETLVATEYSAGNFDSEQLDEAYLYFSFPSRDNGITEDLIIGNFQARLGDSAKHEAEMRAHLKVIGEHRHSQRIKDIAEESLNTYEQALAFFDAQSTVADEFIPTLYTTKTSEDPTLKESARKAVQLIAEARNSTALRSWLSTGELGETSMDIGEAYRQFGIDDRTIDETMIESAYRVAMEDNPGQSESYTRAFNAIVADRQGSQLQVTSRGGQSFPELGYSDWPVGLENIGNTCYLNSLLQFLFTIPELRKLVLNFDDVSMELTPENIARKRVGSRQITLREIQRAQRFVLKLKDLFLEMITTPYRYVAPEQELTRLTLMTSTAAENIRRRSTIGGSRPLGTVDGLPVQGPLGPQPNLNEAKSDDQPMLSPFAEDGPPRPVIAGPVQQEASDLPDSALLLSPSDGEVNVSGDNSSEVTLVSTPSVDDSVMVDGASKLERQRMLGDKENLPPVKTDTEAGENVSAEENSADVTTSGLIMQDTTEAIPTGEKNSTQPTAGSIPSETPSRPPPIPPRPLPAPQQDHSLEEYARQQDVTEVLNHVLFQLSCAIKPIAFDEEGEQIDQIKELFYGRTKQHIMSDDKDEAKNDWFCSIIVRLFSLPNDIYAALDGYFDVEEIANKKRFFSISRLPPIFQIQIDRAGLDQKKNNHHVELKETIYLDRYLEGDTNPALMERRQEAWAWKKELADLEARRVELTADQSHPDAQTAFHDARTVLMHLQELSSKGETGLEVPPSAIATLESLAEQTQLELQNLVSRSRDLATNINSQFADSAFRRHAYRLHAAFFHHGSASSGHYWIYIYDFHKEMWLKYNDTRVEEVSDTNEIFRRPSEAEFRQWNGPSNPYYLVYVRDEDKDQLVQSVCRDIQLTANFPKEIETSESTAAANGAWSGNAQSEHSVSVPLALRDRGNPSGEWDRSEANVYTKW